MIIIRNERKRLTGDQGVTGRMGRPEEREKLDHVGAAVSNIRMPARRVPMGSADQYRPSEPPNSTVFPTL